MSTTKSHGRSSTQEKPLRSVDRMSENTRDKTGSSGQYGNQAKAGAARTGMNHNGQANHPKGQ